MATKVKDRPKAKTAYEADFHRWLMEQAELIRSGRIDLVDSENVAEELEGMARSEFRSLVSALRVLVMHMLKWDLQPERRSASWAGSIREQRYSYIDIIDDNPSLKPRRDEALAKAYRRAVVSAMAETGVREDRFAPQCPYDWDDLLTRPFEADSAPAPK
jgi:hypothetical protein